MKSILYKTIKPSLFILFFFVMAATVNSQITITGERVLCNTNETTITAYAEGAATYLWSIGEVVPSITITQAGTYSVTVVYINGNSSSRNIKILDSKMVSELQADFCKNSTATISPAITDGTWTANNPNIATITSDGRMTAIDTGKATFSFHFDHSTCVAETKEFEVFPLPEVSSSKAGYCLEDVIQLSPTQGGTWSSLQTQIATIKNNGEGKPLAPGNPKFIFTSEQTGCSQTLENVVIYPKPVVELSGNDSICIGFTVGLKPFNGGTWSTNNFMVASINNAGLVTGLQPGQATFVYHQNSTGCSSNASPTITVLPTPKIITDLPKTLCLGGDNIMLTAPGKVYWTSINPALASINNQGVIYVRAPGNAQFVYTPIGISCASEPITFTVQNIKPIISNHIINQNSFIDLKSDAPGIWTSMHPNILSLSENKKAISHKAGKTKLEYVADAGCYAYFDIEVKAGKIGSNADVNQNNLSSSSDDGNFSAFIDVESRDYNNSLPSSQLNGLFYPNPFSSELSIQNYNNWNSFQIYDNLGSLIYSSTTIQREINTSDWLSGVYIIKFTKGQESITQKLIKL